MKNKIIYFIIFFFILFCSFHLNSDVHNDEASYYFRGQLDLIPLLSEGIQPPMYPLINSFLPKNIIVLRMINIFFGCLTIIVFYNLLNLFFNKSFSVYGLFILISNPYFIKFSCQSRPYALALLLSLLSTYLFLKNKNLTLYILISMLAVYTHLFTFFIILGHMVSCNWLGYDKFRKQSLPTMIITFCLFPLQVVNVYNKGFMNWRTFNLVMPLKTIIFLFGSLPLLIFFIILVVYKIDILKQKQFKIFLSFFIGFLFVGIISFVFPIWHDRYFYFWIPYIIVLLLIVVVRIKKSFVLLFTLFLLIFNISTIPNTIEPHPLRDSLHYVGSYGDLIIHRSSFSFLPYEFMKPEYNNFVINNLSYYGTPIYQKELLINDLPSSSYFLVTDYTEQCDNIYFEQQGLKICIR